MKKTILFLGTALLLTAFVAGDRVYICISKTASKYHLNHDCQGLKKCTHTIEEVSKAEAKERGYTLCGFED